MIEERMGMLDIIKMQLIKSIEKTDIFENVLEFNRLCNANQIIIDCDYDVLIPELYAVNTALEYLRDGVGNGIWPKEIKYDNITGIVADIKCRKSLLSNYRWKKKTNNNIM